MSEGCCTRNQDTALRSWGQSKDGLGYVSKGGGATGLGTNQAPHFCWRAGGSTLTPRSSSSSSVPSGAPAAGATRRHAPGAAPRGPPRATRRRRARRQLHLVLPQDPAEASLGSAAAQANATRKCRFQRGGAVPQPPGHGRMPGQPPTRARAGPQSASPARRRRRARFGVRPGTKASTSSTAPRSRRSPVGLVVAVHQHAVTRPQTQEVRPRFSSLRLRRVSRSTSRAIFSISRPGGGGCRTRRRSTS